MKVREPLGLIVRVGTFFFTLSKVTNQFFYFYRPLLIQLIISLYAFYSQNYYLLLLTP